MKHNNLHEMLLAAAATRLNAPAFRHIQGGMVRQIRYRDLARLTFLFAQAYAARGLKSGDRIILCADNSPEWVLACFGAFRLGLVVVPVDARSRHTDLEVIGNKIKPALYVLGRIQHAALADNLHVSQVAVLDELLSAIALDVASRPVVELKPVAADWPALIVFTSGTSGASKGVVLTHANIVANVSAITQRFDVDSGDKLLSVLPLSHMFEFTAGLVGPLVSGATIVYARIRGPEHLKELLKIEKISVLIGVPAVFQNIYKGIESALAQLPPNMRLPVEFAKTMSAVPLAGSVINRLLLSSIHRELGGRIKFWAAGGAPVSEELVKNLAQIGIPLLAGYGLTEASPVVATNMRSDNNAGTAGRPLQNVQVKILPVEDAASADGDPVQGEILVRGPSVMSGYYDESDATAETIRQGWLHTGDVGYLDNDGYLHVTARIKSTIITAGGYNIQPEELESAISLSPAVKEVCVFGLKSGIGEQPHALIIPNLDDRGMSELTAVIKDELARTLSQLAEYKRLSGFQLYDGEFPKTRLGKVQRRKVAEIYEAIQKDSNSLALIEPEWDEDGKDVCAMMVVVLDPSAGTDASKLNINPRSNLAGDLNLDSFARLELAVQLEEHFGCDIPEDLINDVQTADELVALVKSQKKKAIIHDAVIPDCQDLTGDSNEYGSTMRSYINLDAGLFSMKSSLDGATQRWPFAHSTDDYLASDSPFVVAARKSLVLSIKVLLKIVGDFQTAGADRLTIDPPFIVVANHSSHIDTAAIFASFPPGLLPLVYPVAAADTFFTNKVSALLASNLLNAVAFDRFGSFEHSLQECEDVLRQGQILIMFPEGTRSTTGKIGTFRNGAARLAVSVGCPVVPAYINGAYEMMPKKAVFPQFGKLRVDYGLPIYPPPAPANMKQLQEFTSKLQQSVLQLSRAQEQQPIS